jgi:hypothetical protein
MKKKREELATKTTFCHCCFIFLLQVGSRNTRGGGTDTNT